MNEFNGELKVVFNVWDYNTALHYYREVIGLLPNYTWFINDTTCGTRFYMGNGKMEIVKRVAVETVGALRAQCRDVDQCFARLNRYPGNVTISALVDQDNERSFTILDPCGNLLNIYEPLPAIHDGTPLKKEELFEKAFCGLIYTRNLSEMVTFYRDVIGLVQRDEKSETCFAIGKNEIRLLSGDLVIPSGKGMLAFEATNVDRVYKRFIGVGVHIFQDLHDTFYGVRKFCTQDPDGNMVEIYSNLLNIRDEKVV